MSLLSWEENAGVAHQENGAIPMFAGRSSYIAAGFGTAISLSFRTFLRRFRLYLNNSVVLYQQVFRIEVPPSVPNATKDLIRLVLCAAIVSR